MVISSAKKSSFVMEKDRQCEKRVRVHCSNRVSVWIFQNEMKNVLFVVMQKKDMKITYEMSLVLATL